MVPYILYRCHDFDATIATYRNNENYRYLEDEVRGLTLDIIPKKFKNRNVNIALYILKNFKKIDILQLYHFEIDQLDILGMYIILKRIFFQRPFTYIKCDGSDRFTNTDLKKIKFKFFRKWVIGQIDLFTVETTTDFKIIRSLKDYQGINLQLMPNGFFDNGEKIDISQPKEKIILTVGRLGTHQKNTEFLLASFTEFAKTNHVWKLCLVGSIEEDFKSKIETFFQENPSLRDRVHFTGPIADRKIMQDYYRRSAVFILTSRAEGSPLVLPESLSMGCFNLLSNKINLRDDVMNNGRFGTSFSIENTAELVSVFQLLDSKDFEVLKYEIQKSAYEQFYWPKVLETIETSYKKY